MSFFSVCPKFFLFSLFIIQAKAKSQSAKVNINSALVEDIISLDEVKEDMAAVLNALEDDFTRNLSIRTSPGSQLIFLYIFFLDYFLLFFLSLRLSFLTHNSTAEAKHAG